MNRGALRGESKLQPVRGATGTVDDWAGSPTSLPSYSLLCDGSAVSRTAYPALFAAIGVTWGAGDGASTFNIPNVGGRVIVAYKAGDATFGTVGAIGGATTHTHAAHVLGATGAEAAHTHAGSGNTGAEASHTHAAGTFASPTSGAGSSHSHSHSHSANTYASPTSGAEAAHTHSGTGNTGAEAAHTHAGSGNTGAEAAHTHAHTHNAHTSVASKQGTAAGNVLTAPVTHSSDSTTGSSHVHTTGAVGAGTSHVHTAGAVGAGSSHVHTGGTITGTSGTDATAEAAHTHAGGAVTGASAGGSSHLHTTGAVGAGSSHTHAAGTISDNHDTPTSLPPYIVMPCIIWT